MADRRQNREAFEIEILEPRVLLSADGVGAVVVDDPSAGSASDDGVALAEEVVFLTRVTAAELAEARAQASAGDDGGEGVFDGVDGEGIDVVVDPGSGSGSGAEDPSPDPGTPGSAVDSVLPAPGDFGAGEAPGVVGTDPDRPARRFDLDGDPARGPPPAGDLTLVAGDELSGNGTVSGSLMNVGGLVSPGNSPGIIEVLNDFGQDGGRTLIEIGEGGNDVVQIGGNATFGGTLEIAVLGNPTIQAGDRFTIVTWGGVQIGEFENYLGTASIPGGQLAFVPEYDPVGRKLELAVVDTQSLATEVELALDEAKDIVGNLIDIQGGVPLPMVGDPVKELINAKDRIENAIIAEIDALIAMMPTQAELTAEIEGWDGTTLANFDVSVDSVLGHYTGPGSTVQQWDVKLTLVETSLFPIVGDVLNKVFDFAFGPNSSLTLENALELDFSFGRDGLDPFIILREGTARVTAVASNINPLALLPPLPPVSPVQFGVDVMVLFEAFVSVVPDPNVLPDGRVDFANFGSALGGFKVEKGGSFDATLTLNLSASDPNELWSGFSVVDYDGVHKVRLIDNDLFDMVDPDMQFIVDGELTLFEQQHLQGVFTFTKPALDPDTYVDAVISDLELNAGFGPAEFRVLKATGTGSFVMRDNGDFDGTATLNLIDGPDLPEIVDTSGSFTLDFDTATEFYRISGQNVNLTIGDFLPEVNVSGDFVFEPKDTDANPANGKEDIVVAVTNLAASLRDFQGNPVVSITNASGGFVFTTVGGEDAVAAVIDQADFTLNIPGLTGTDGDNDGFLDGTFGFAFKNVTAPITRTVDLNGSPFSISLPDTRKLLRVTGTGVTLDLSLGGLTGLPMALSGDFTFEQHTTDDDETTVVVGFDNVSLPFVAEGGNPVLTVDGLSGILIDVPGQGLAGQLEVDDFSLGVAGAVQLTKQPSSLLGVQVKQFLGPVDVSVDVGGQTVSAVFGEDKYIKFVATDLQLEVLDFPLVTGDFAFEQRESEGGTTYLTIVGDDIQFDLGPAESLGFDISDGHVLYLVDGNGESAAQGMVTVNVPGNIPGFTISSPGQPSGTIVMDFAYNTNALMPVDEIFDWEGTPAPVQVPQGPFLEIGGPLELSVDVGIGVQTLSGIFHLSQQKDDGNVPFVGIRGEELRLDLKAGPLPVISFHEGAGQFGFFEDGIAGKVEGLQFEVGLIGVTGAIDLELNNTNQPIAANGSGFALNLPAGDYFELCVDGHIQVGPAAVPAAFTISNDFTADTLLFTPKNPVGPPIVTVHPNGQIDHNLDLPDFDLVTEADLFAMVKQIISWLGLFRGTGIFNTEIPFTGGTTVGDAFDFAQWFLSEIYAEVAVVEVLSGSFRTDPGDPGQFIDAAGDPVGVGDLPLAGSLAGVALTFEVAEGGEVAVPFSGAFTSPATLVDRLNAGLQGSSLAGAVEARLNKDGIVSFTLSEGEVPLHSQLMLESAGAGLDLGFGDQQAGVEGPKYALEGMIAALGQALTGVPGSYDPEARLVRFAVDESINLPAIQAAFDLGGGLGPIGGVDVEGALAITPTVDLDFTLGFDFGAFDVPRVFTSPLVPVPSNGRLSDDATFFVYLNGSPVPDAVITLDHTATQFHTSVQELAAYINTRFTAAGLGQQIVAQKAGQGLAISALLETDVDGDGFEPMNPLEDLNLDGDQDSQLGIINHLRLSAHANDPAATELGIGSEADDDNPGFVTEEATAPVNGLFLEDVLLGGTLGVSGNVTGEAQLGFLKLDVAAANVGTPSVLMLSAGLRDQENGNTRFYIPELMNKIASIGDILDAPTLTGGFEADFTATTNALGLNITNGQILIELPDINDPSGLGVTLNNLDAAQGFECLSFLHVVQLLGSVAETLEDVETFSFLDEDLPFVEMSLADMLSWASKVGELFQAVGEGDAEDAEELAQDFEDEFERIFDVPNRAGTNDPSIEVTVDTSGGGQALAFHLEFRAGWGQTIPLMLDLRSLVSRITDNPQAQAFLQQATEFLVVEGDGMLNVAAAAVVNLDFGIDLEDPCSPAVFLYDTTMVSFEAEVLGSDLEFEASLGSLTGIFVKDGTVTLDADGDPETVAPASITFGFRDNNGDGRHYFSESLFDSESIGFSARAGFSADLPVFAPTESQPLGPTTDDDGNGFPDNHLVVDIPDLLRLFLPDRATNGMVDLEFRGDGNDLVVAGPVATFDVVVVNNPNTAPDATWNGSTLTLSIDSGVTDASDIVDEINDLGGFSAVLAMADDDGDPATTLDNGKLSKTTIATPDFNDLFNNADLCAVIDQNSGLILDGLDSLLATIQDGLEEVLSIRLPLIGDVFGGVASFIQSFRNGLLSDLRTAVQMNSGSGSQAIETAIRKALWNNLGPSGANLLVDPVTGLPFPDQTGGGFAQLDVSLDCENGLLVNTRLHDDLVAFDTGDALDIDIGVPGFGLDVEGSIALKVGWDFKLRWGATLEDGFFFDTTGSHTLKNIDLANLTGAANVDTGAEFFIGLEVIPTFDGYGELALLRLEVEDLGSFFKAGFEIDIMDPGGDGKLTVGELFGGGLDFRDVFSPRIGAEAQVDLQLVASFGGNTNFPRVLAQFHLDWEWDLIGGAGKPHVMFDEIYLDLGSYISDTLGPVLGELYEFTKPIDPILDLVTDPLPILSDLAGKPVTFLDLAEAFGYINPGTKKFIEIVGIVVDLIQEIGQFTGKSILIPIGAFEMLADEFGNLNRPNPVGELFENLDKDLDKIQAANDGGGAEINASVGFVSEIDASIFYIPIFDNPAELFNIFIGEPVRLFEIRMPTFAFEFTYVQRIPIWGPLYARFGGGVGAYINAGIGYDTYGIEKFAASKDPADLAEGIYIVDWEKDGSERPEIRLTGEIFAGASINLVAVEVGVEGGVRVTVDFDLFDLNNDGKLRFSELATNAAIDPRCIFEIFGKVELFLRAFLTVDLLLFSIEEVWEFGSFTLFEFESLCPLPQPASEGGPNEVLINIGSRAWARDTVNTEDGNETFVITHLGGDKDGETIEVAWQGFTKEFKNVKTITIEDAGDGDDHIEFRNVLAEIQIMSAGAGNDTILLLDRGDVIVEAAGGTIDGGPGNDVITVTGSGPGLTLKGGAGEDVLTAGFRAITIEGGDGRDLIYGSPDTTMGDLLKGGDGADVIFGYGGNDTIFGDGGNDDIDAGFGDDMVHGGLGSDTIWLRAGDDRAWGDEGDDLIYGSVGDDIIAGGADNDQIFGHSGRDVLIGDDYASVTFSIDDATNATAANPVLVAHVTGITGEGDDFLVGGGSYDFIFGGDGDDYILAGNFFADGQSEVIEEDDNDFVDGGKGDDEIHGDDSHGKTGIRDTGIAVASVVWLDENDNALRDPGEPGIPGVTVELWSQSAPPTDPVDTVVTGPDGSFRFNGLDPDYYWMTFRTPFYQMGPPELGLKLVIPEPSYDGPNEAFDSDVTPTTPGFGSTANFLLSPNFTLSTVTAGFVGEVIVDVADVSVEEGNAGLRSAVFEVTMSRQSSVPVSVDFEVVPIAGSATAGTDEQYQEGVAGIDFVARSGTLVFEPGEVYKQVVVPIVGDVTYESNVEQFRLNLSSLQASQPNVVFRTGNTVSMSALGRIVGDDPVPGIIIGDSVPETPSGSFVVGDRVADYPGESDPAEFSVKLTNPSDSPVTVRYQVVDGSLYLAKEATHYAEIGVDVKPVHPWFQTIHFAPGQTEKTIKITLLDDDVDEYDEQFIVQLFDAYGAVIEDGHGVGIIPDDDDPVLVKLEPVGADPGAPDTRTVAEGQPVTFRVTLHDPANPAASKASGKTVEVNYATAHGTAVPILPEDVLLATGQVPDYDPVPNAGTPDSLVTLTFEPGQTQKFVTVWTLNDTFPEATETFFFNLIGAEEATVVQNHAVARITDDDTGDGNAGLSPIGFTETNYYVTEGDPGDPPTFAEITLGRVAGTQGDAVVVFYTQDETATNGVDYQGGNFIVHFAPGELTKTVQIPIIHDLLVEADETARLTMRGLTGKPASGAPYEATLTIIDDDSLKVQLIDGPRFDVEQPEVFIEGSAPSVTVKVRLVNHQLMAPNAQFRIHTEGITALGGLDFAILSNVSSLSFGQGLDFDPDPYVAVKIPVTDDLVTEAVESFRVYITDPVGGLIENDMVVVQIVDNELDEVQGTVFEDRNGNGYRDFGERAMRNLQVEITGADGVTHTSTTDKDGIYKAMVPHGQVDIRVIEESLVDATATQPGKFQLYLPFFFGYELSTGNDNQTVEFRGGNGIDNFEDIGYKPRRLVFALPRETEPVGRGGTDDTIFGGPGSDLIDAGGGDDHVIGGHWQTATSAYAPINQDPGVYEAKVTAVDPNSDYQVLRPLNGFIFAVDDTGMGNDGRIYGNAFKDTDADGIFDPGTLVLMGEAGFPDINLHLLDKKGNIVNSTVTNSGGGYEFDGLFPGDYRIEIEVPDGFNVTNAASLGLDTLNRTSVVTITGADNVLRRIGLDDAPLPPPGPEVTFEHLNYTVEQGEQDGLVVISLVRGQASTRAAVVVSTEDDTAMDGVHYDGFVDVLVHFEVGQFRRSLAIPILAGGPIPECGEVVADLILRSATGRPIDTAMLHIQHPLNGEPDDDTILGGDDWDIILGDSGSIPAHVHSGRFVAPGVPPGDPNPAPLPELDPYAELTFAGGPGEDSINAGESVDFVFGQGGDDLLDGWYGRDYLDGSVGADHFLAGWGNDVFVGGPGTAMDTVEARRDGDHTVIEGQTDWGDIPKWRGGFNYPVINSMGADSIDITFPVSNWNTRLAMVGIENVRLVGGFGANTFTLTGWQGSATIYGSFGKDTLVVENDTDMKFTGGGQVSLDTVKASIGKVFFAVQDGGKVSSQGLNSVAKFELAANGEAPALGADAGFKPAVALAKAPFLVKLMEGGKSGLSLGNGSFYALYGIDDAHLIGGPSPNKLDATFFHGDVVFEGRGGDDELTGGKGDDTFLYTYLDSGADRIRGDNVASPQDHGFDTVDLSAFSEDLEVDLSDLSGPKAIFPGGPALWPQKEDIDRLIGGAGNDTLTGNKIDNVLVGGPGNDILVGLGGSETYAFDADEDWGLETIIEAPGDPTGIDTLDFSATTTVEVTVDLALLNTVQTIGGLMLNLGGGGLERVVGGALDDTLLGNAEDNLFEGRNGNDVMDGRAGYDTVVDTVGGTVTLDDTLIWVTAADADNLVSIENARLKGSAGPDHFDLTGWSGDATILAGTGTDIFAFTGGGTLVLSDLGAGGVRIERDSPPVSNPPVFDQTIDLEGFEEVRLTGEATEDSFDASGLTLDGNGQPRVQLVLDGAGGDDVIVGSPWDDLLTGGPGNDDLTGGTGNDIVDGGAGSDQFLETRDDDFVFGAGQVTIGGAETDVLASIEGVVITGGPGNNTFDISAWTAGDATIDGAGGAGDTLLAQGDADYTITDASISVNGSNAGMTATNIENVFIIGGPGDNVLDASGFSGNVGLSGMGGNDLLIGGAGNDLLVGGDGNDVLVGSSGTDALAGQAGDDRYAFNVDAFAVGSTTNVFETTGIDTLDFSSTVAGSLFFNLQGGAVAQGVHPNLTLILNGADLIENALGGQAGDNIAGNTLDNRIDGQGGSDIVRGLAGDDILVASGGDDDLRGGVDDDTYLFDGDVPTGLVTVRELAGEGFDILDFSATDAAVTAKLGDGTVQTVVADGSLQLRLSPADGPEMIIGGSGDDFLSGTTTSQQLVGGPGVDTLSGAVAAAFVDGDNDAKVTDGSLVVATKDGTVVDSDILSGVAAAILEGGDGDNVLDASGVTAFPVVLVANGGDDTLLGGDLGDFLEGGDGNDLLRGGRGGDSLEGDLGDDTYVWNGDTDTGSDQVDDAGGVDTFDFSDTAVSGLNLDLAAPFAQPVTGAVVLTLAVGSPAQYIENVIGGAAADIIRGTSEANRLEGGGGDDFLDGRNGNDTYAFNADVPLGRDTVVDSGGFETLDFSPTVNTGVSVALSIVGADQVANANLVLRLNTAVEAVTGGGGDDTLSGTGNAVANQLSGGPGNDTILADSDDILVVRRGGEIVLTDTTLAVNGTETDTLVGVVRAILLGGAGDDVLDASGFLGATALGISGGDGDDVIYGSPIGDILLGGAGDDVLFGGDGNDSISGQAGDDYLAGGGGDDALFGGVGDDVYAFFGMAFPLGTDEVNELAGEGFDRLEGAGAGVDVDLGSTAFQVLTANLTLRLVSLNVEATSL